MKQTLVSAIMIGGLIAPVAGAFAEDVDDVTMQVVGPEATPDAVTQRIELPAQVREQARKSATDGLETANQQRERNQERLRTNREENEQREEMQQHRKEMREQLQEQREEMNQEMRQEQYEFQQQTRDQREQ
ncbi:hypothetical protein [Thiohalomonas denitrificans]|uniref:hypothetical protein n=1 Tax=Thiohalomonas denitrificans TaxID=415747 RepID=UPI0026F0B83A|nr:hypothetical protein [Thiohalomonas denitrificans]